jgi:beta-glucuronidase
MGWWIVPCVLLGVTCCILIYLLWQLFGYRRKVEPKLPLQWLDGIPLLMQNGLPYPGRFSYTGDPVMDLDGEWLFGVGNALLDGELPLEKVRVPVSFNTLGTEYADYQGVFSYVKRFQVDKEEGRLYRLCFKGVGGVSSVYLNGRKLCDNTDSYQPFYCDATGALRAGENVLTVVGDNTPSETTLPLKQFEGHKAGWHLYAGITKSVKLETLPENYCVDLRLSSGEQTLSGNVIFAGRPHGCAIRLLDGERVLAGKTLVLRENGGYATAAFSFECLRGIEPWSPDAPKLYTVEVRSDAQIVCVSTGFRELCTEKGTIRLNGNPFAVRGICLHEEDIVQGASLERQAIERNLDLVRALGCNFARLAHYPHSDEALDYCDEKGLLCWCEIPNYQAGLGLIQLLFGKSERLKKRMTLRTVWQGVSGTKQLLDERYLANAGIQLAKMVIRNQNRPCVAFWGAGNECFSYTPASRDALCFLRDTVLLFDAARFVGYAAFTAPGVTKRFEKSFQVFDFVCVNEYYGWYYGQTDDCAAFWSGLQNKYRKPMLCTETGSDARQGAQGIDLPERNANSEDYQSSLLSRHIRLQKDVPGYCGTCIWALKDFYCDEYGAEDLVPYFNAKGLVSSSYKKKKAFDTVAEMYKAAQSVEKGRAEIPEGGREHKAK